MHKKKEVEMTTEMHNIYDSDLLSKCVFCNSPDTNLILFTVETLNKCKVILKHRKEHNLKYKDVALPVNLYDNGYHRQCKSSFTGLMKKYYKPKSESVENITHISTSCLSTPKLDVQRTEVESLDNSIPRPTSAFTLDSKVKLEPIPQALRLVKSVPPQESSLNLENDNLPSEIDVLEESGISTDPKNVFVYFVTKKPKRKPLKDFL